MYYCIPRQNYTNMVIVHSAKGSTWKNHKYIKKIQGRYYYAKDKIAEAKDKFIWEHGGKESKEFTEAANLYNLARDTNRWAELNQSKRPSYREQAKRISYEKKAYDRMKKAQAAYEKTPLNKYYTMRDNVKKTVSNAVNAAKKAGSMVSKKATSLYKKGQSFLKKIFNW